MESQAVGDNAPSDEAFLDSALEDLDSIGSEAYDAVMRKAREVMQGDGAAGLKGVRRSREPLRGKAAAPSQTVHELTPYANGAYDEPASAAASDATRDPRASGATRDPERDPGLYGDASIDIERAALKAKEAIDDEIRDMMAEDVAAAGGVDVEAAVEQAEFEVELQAEIESAGQTAAQATAAAAAAREDILQGGPGPLPVGRGGDDWAAVGGRPAPLSMDSVFGGSSASAEGNADEINVAADGDGYVDDYVAAEASDTYDAAYGAESDEAPLSELEGGLKGVLEGGQFLLAHTKNPWRGRHVDAKRRADRRKKEAAEQRARLAKARTAIRGLSGREFWQRVLSGRVFSERV